MKKFTLDTNCIIDLEESRPNAAFVNEIVRAWRDVRIELAVVAIGASENQQNGQINRNFSSFENKLANVGLAGVSHLLPLAIWDLFYWDHFLWGSPESLILLNTIQSILFPNEELIAPIDAMQSSKWRNRQCDVLTAWSHAFHKWDILVTSDKNFHDHNVELKKFGITEILYPKEAALICQFE
jgi:hypothetical protein